MTATAIAVLLAAAGLCAGSLPILIRALQRSRVLDVPGVRSSHTSATPRGAGVSVMGALLLATVWTIDNVSGPILLAVLLASGTGLLEDLRGTGIAARLLLQVAAVLPLAVAAPIWSGTMGLHGTALGVAVLLVCVAVLNAVNFMDGVNGITAGVVSVAALAYAHALDAAGEGRAALVGLAAFGACVAFLPFNAPSARVFLGDSGSYGLGSVLAGLGVATWVATDSLLLAVAPLTVYVADTSTTLLRRAARGEPWHLPHRTHVYQRLTDRGWSHSRVASYVTALSAVCALVGLLGNRTQPGVAAAVLGGVAAAYLATPAVLAGRAAPRGRTA